MSPATQPTQPSAPAAVIILAAGEGTRMKSSTPKVLHPVMGRSLLGHVVAACAPMGAAHTLVVVGHGREAVTEHLAEFAPSARAVEQREQNGTGHAVRVALDTVPDAEGTVVVVLADTPLLTTDTLMQLVTSHEQVQASATVLTARLADPTGYGRIVRSVDGGNVTAIVEHRDADEQTRAIDEVNSGIFAFDARALRLALGRLTTNNSQGEEYLTDVVALLAEGQARVDAVVVADADEVIGVNDRVQLAAAASVLQRRINESWMRAGVTIVDPASVFIGVDVTIAADAVIAPWTVLEGTTHVGANAVVGPGAHLANCTVDEGATVRFTTGDQAVIGPHASAGPYTYLRPGTHLGRGARAGAFVETKNALVGDGSKVPHLSYVGDAEIGEGSNIGAATVFVNYDGVEKHRTVIGDHVRIGSDTMLVAPVTVGDGAYTAAGSVITDDVPPGAMGVARARQRTIRDWVLRRRSGTASADAALAAQQAAGDEQDQPGSDTGSSAGDNDLRNDPSSEGTDA